MACRAILFDLDGTLLDTLEDLADAVNEALARGGFPPRSLDEYRFLVGDGARNLVRRALPPEHRDDATVEPCLDAFGAAYARLWDRKTRPYPGIPELLDALAARGLPMAVLSNKPDDFTKLCVARLLPRGRFAVVRGARPDTPPKPDPAAALAIAKQVGVPPADFLYVGDSNTDMGTARAAGMFPVGVTWGFRPASELLEHGARILITEPILLLKLLGI
jgi:phosphoglycolate phosphatase